MTPLPPALARLGKLVRAGSQQRPAVESRAKLTALHALVARTPDELFATTDLTRHEAQVFSQNGEDGVIVEIFTRIGATSRFFVEFGIQTGHEGNCVFLADVLGWSGLFIEGNADNFAQLDAKYHPNPRVRTRNAKVTPGNVQRLFRDADVPAEFDLLSIDIDGNDIWVWRAITEFRPRMVVIEYNSLLDVDVPKCQAYAADEDWNGTAGFGSSLAALDRAAEKLGYRLVHTDQTGVNAFYLRDDLVPLLGVSDVSRRSANFYLAGGRHGPGEPAGGWADLGTAHHAG